MKFILTLLVDLLIIAAFIGGNMYGAGGLVNITVFVLWFSAIVSLPMLSDTLLDKIPNLPPLTYPQWLAITLESVLIIAAVFYGYFILGAFLMVMMAGQHNYRKFIKNKGN